MSIVKFNRGPAASRGSFLVRFLVSGFTHRHRLALFSHRAAKWQKGSNTLLVFAGGGNNGGPWSWDQVLPSAVGVWTEPLHDRTGCADNNSLNASASTQTMKTNKQKNNNKQQEGGRCCIEPILTMDRNSAAAIFFKRMWLLIKSWDLLHVYAILFFLVLQRK